MIYRNLFALFLLFTTLMPPGLVAGETQNPSCNSLDDCMRLMAQPANPPATYPYGMSGHDMALVKKVRSYGPKAIPGLLTLLKDPHIDVYQRSGDALEDIQGLTPADLPALVEAAKNGNSAVPGAIGLIGTPEAINALMDLVRANPQEAEESQISWGLERLKSKSLPYLVEAMRCKGTCDQWYLYAIEHILANMPKDVKPDSADLVAILADKSLSSYSRQSALMAIRDFKVNDPVVVKTVAQAATEPDLRDDAIEALVAMQSKEAVRYLVVELHEVNNWGAAGVLEDIAMLGAAGVDGGADIVPYLENPDWDTRVEAATALGSIGYRPAIPALMERLRAPDWRLSYEAARALGLMQAKEARPALEDVSLRYWFKPVRTEAGRALTAIDSGDPLQERDDTGVFGRGNAALSIYMVGLPSYEDDDTCKSGRVRWRENSFAIDDVKTWPSQQGAPNFALPDYATGVMTVENGWLVGRDKGEFGGGLYEYDKSGNKTDVLAPMDENIHGIYRIGSTLLAVGGLAHMILDHGRVYRLDQVQEGEWKAMPLVELPGAPIKVGILDDDHIVISAIGGVVSVDSNGQTVSLECVQ